MQMCEARLTTEWDRTASLMAIVHNSQCTKSSQQIRDPGTLNPLRARARKAKIPLATLRQMMTGRKTAK
jgi:hypothetical protein